ncbi:MAG: hypothetical protein NC311_19565 [Muribaculaceae bacterium]|nr:hypothetical protein [Muribaculaceae bacterium]
MDIMTKYAIGDILWRVRNSKAESFECRVIAYDKAASYGPSIYDLCEEPQCFASKEELLAYVAGE